MCDPRPTALSPGPVACCAATSQLCHPFSASWLFLTQLPASAFRSPLSALWFLWPTSRSPLRSQHLSHLLRLFLLIAHVAPSQQSCSCLPTSSKVQLRPRTPDPHSFCWPRLSPCPFCCGHRTCFRCSSCLLSVCPPGLCTPHRKKFCVIYLQLKIVPSTFNVFGKYREMPLRGSDLTRCEEGFSDLVRTEGRPVSTGQPYRRPQPPSDRASVVS